MAIRSPTRPTCPVVTGTPPAAAVDALAWWLAFGARALVQTGVLLALTAFGMPMGPIELVDTVGLDIAVAAGKALAGAEAVLPRTLADKVAAGQLGRKSGQGFYLWQGGKAQKSAPGPLPDGLAERIVLPLRQAVQACVDKGVVADADLADAGVIFGTGYAPFTGGPLHHLACRAHP